MPAIPTITKIACVVLLRRLRRNSANKQGTRLRPHMDWSEHIRSAPFQAATLNFRSWLCCGFVVDKRSIIISTATPVLCFMLLTGCVSPPHSATPSQSSSKKPATSSPTVPVPVASSTAGTAALDCRTLVTSAAWVKLTSNGLDASPEFETKVRREGGDLARLLDLGGIACQWGYPGTDAAVVLGFAYITPLQATHERENLSSNGWVPSIQKDGRELWALANTENMLGNVPAYEFREGNVRFALDAESSFDYFAV